MHHGVAILSRLPLHDSGRHDWQDNGEARHVGARLDCGIRLENVYIPAGGDIPDRDLNPKFGQKLDFIERMTRWSEKLAEPTLIVGDFNIAPLECDVWSHKALVDVVSHTPIEIDALDRLQRAHDWVDLGRQLHPRAGSAISPGGAIARRTRPPTTAAAASTICGPARACRAGHRAPRARTVPQLGTAVGPCPADRRVRALSEAAPLERAIAALRAGRPVALDGQRAAGGRNRDRRRCSTCSIPSARRATAAERAARRRARAGQ